MGISLESMIVNFNFFISMGSNFISLFDPIVVPSSIVTQISLTKASSLNFLTLWPRLMFSDILKMSTKYYQALSLTFHQNLKFLTHLTFG